MSETGRPQLGRREFLVAATGAFTAASVACRRPYDPKLFIHAERSPVGIFAAGPYGNNLADVVYRGIRELSPAVAGRRVLLKPNIVEFERDTVINTHASVVAAAADAFLRVGAREVIVGEGPGHRRDIEYLLGVTGLFDYLRDRRLSFVDLNHDDVTWTTLKTHFTGLKELALSSTLLSADVIVSMPKLKTHHWTTLTAGMKNLFGTVPGAVYGWPKNVLHVAGIERSILDLAATIRPHFTIVDGVVGMEGDGPIMGTPKPVGAIVMGQDVVAVDATCARVMGIDPNQVGYLTEANRFLGNAAADRIDMRGEALARFATVFQLPPRLSAVSAG